jgi:hypothetical protein
VNQKINRFRNGNHEGYIASVESLSELSPSFVQNIKKGLERAEMYRDIKNYLGQMWSWIFK